MANDRPSTASSRRRLCGPLDISILIREVGLGSPTSTPVLGRDKEFESSPQSEWLDLDIVRDGNRIIEGPQWNSGFNVAARIDSANKIWYAVMEIPFAKIDTRPEVISELRRTSIASRFTGVSEACCLTWKE